MTVKEVKHRKVKVEITNLNANCQVVYIADPDSGVPAGCDENKDCKLVIEAAESVIVKVDAETVPALRQRVEKIEGIRIDLK